MLLLSPAREIVFCHFKAQNEVAFGLGWCVCRDSFMPN